MTDKAKQDLKIVYAFLDSLEKWQLKFVLMNLADERLSYYRLLEISKSKTEETNNNQLFIDLFKKEGK